MTPNSVLQKTIRLDRPIVVAGFTYVETPMESDHEDVFLYHPGYNTIQTLLWAFDGTDGAERVRQYPETHVVRHRGTFKDTGITHKEIIRGGTIDD